MNPELKDKMRGLLRRSLDAWIIMSECERELWGLAKDPSLTPEQQEQLQHALKHADRSYQHEINGFRDHIKLSIGEI